MKYARLLNNALDFAPQNKGAVINYNTNVELMLQDGYKEFSPATIPTTNRRYHLEYKETSTTLVEVLKYDETQKEANKREEQEKKEYISNLSLTHSDVERAIYEAKGMDFDDVFEAVKNSEITGLDAKRLKIELKSNTFVRKHPYIDIVGQILGYTPEDMDFLFINKSLPIKEEEV